MRLRLWRAARAVLVSTLCISGGATVSAQGPDVIVGELPSTTKWGNLGTVYAYSVGTTSCNIGDQVLLWISSTNQHPVITQNLFRLANNRFEQIGQGWLKHGFCALSGTVCSPACQATGCETLGINCSDPYSASLNGSQSGLGPKSEVNAATGVFPYPFTGQGTTGNVLFKRIQTDSSLLTTPGALYFVSSHYVTPDEPAFGTHLNNEAYRRVLVSGSFDLNTTGITEREKYAIEAWVDQDPSVTMTIVDVASDGRFIVCAKAVPDGANWRYEYAIQNYNSHRSGASLSIPLPVGATASNIGFHDIDYHSGEIYSNTDWTGTSSASAVTWTSPQTFSQNQNTNALRFDTVYSFWFTSPSPPTSGTATLGLFRPGTPSQMLFTTVVPGDSSSPPTNNNCANALVAGAGATPFNTTNATTDGPFDSLCGMTIGQDVWYRYTAPCDGTATVSLCGSSFDTRLAIYAGGCPGAASIACNDNFCSTQSEVSFAVGASLEYWIRIGGAATATGSGTMVITPPDCTPPGAGNDNCVDAIAVADGVPVDGSTTTATDDGTASCGSSASTPDVWYKYTPATSATVTVSTCNDANYDTVLAVFNGCGGTQVGCLDDTAGCAGLTTILSVSMTAATTYWIRVAGYNGAVGDFTLTVTGGGGGVAPTNDDCQDRIGLGLGATPFSTVGATTDGPTHAACLAAGSDQITTDIWYNFPSGFNGTLTVATCGSTFDTKVAVYDDAGCADFEARLLACNDDSCALQSQVTVTVVTGQNYTLRVGGFNGATGSGTVTLTGAPSCTSPSFSAHPASTASCVGSTIVLSATVTGTTPISYQWRKNGAPISGATAASLTLTSITTTTAGNYDLQATNACGTATSNVAVVTVLTAPTIGTQPLSQSGCEGGSITLTVGASGSAPLSYQWRRNGTPISGATASSLVLSPLTPTSAGNYTVVVTNSCSSLTSATALVTVTALPQIVVQPASQSGCVGTSLTLSVSATGATSYQWRKNGASIVGATSASLLLASLSATSAGNYDVLVSNSCGSIPSATAVVTVLTTPSITANPQPASACPGASVVLSVTATGATSFQWRKNSVAIVGATSSALVLSSLAAADAGSYDVLVTNSCGTTTSSAAQVTVLSPTTITQNPSAQLVCLGSGASFTVGATGAGALSYQWRRNGIDVAGATQSTYSIASVSAVHAGNYDAIVTGGCGSATSASATLTIASAPTILSNPASQSVCQGFAVGFTVVAQGTGTLSYQWYLNGGAIGGATAATYSIASAQLAQSGGYHAVVTNSCGSTSSATATLTITPLAACDCNSNGVLDGDEILGGAALDCNSNGVPDECDISSGTSADANSNGVPDECELSGFTRGDVNADGVVNIADAIFSLNYQFGSGAVPSCLDSADINDDALINIGDVVYLLAWQFNDGPDPLPPFGACGSDPSADTFDCASYDACP
ncbi:MAG: immunoglobulin domain-containing protein [Planctomycetota bacterium]